ncbi:uncharacterized protein LOC112555495 [Pomacea canaliculata]|uniref:uncharacterized protein LOC112555495 n=1 Tax=Pomacea canaliculata TaxID=400727 RepID=UPI000D7275D3|nr:uncharacterized protein LOC112555495 [Pomacea canaliculata]
MEQIKGADCSWHRFCDREQELKSRSRYMRQENQELESQVHNLTHRINQLEKQLINEAVRHVHGHQRNRSHWVWRLQFYQGSSTITVYCDQVTDGGGWTVFQRRQDGSVDFFRNWTDYRNGFGDLNGEFWLGLENLHTLTSLRHYELRVDLEAFNGSRAFAHYSGFRIGDVDTDYTLYFDDFLGGNAGDSLTYHKGITFVTRDHGNSLNCARHHHGAWWYSECYMSDLNGIYRPTAEDSNVGGVSWRSLTTDNFSLKRAEMKIRPMYQLKLYSLRFYFCFLTLEIESALFASSALVWSSSPEVKENITACAGDDVSIPWSFTTSPTETVIGITWFLERHDGIRTILSSIIDGEFFSLSRQHVQLVPNAGVRLQNVTVRDTGLYSVHVSTSDDAGHVTINNRSAAVEISAPPVLSDGQFLARRRAAPARDDVTGTWHVVLECGQFTDRGQPPINVQWTSPSGTVHTDVNYQDGYFLLPLQAVETGNYTCSLTGSSPARRCLASDSILLRETAVYVDDENVKWTVMEANQREFIEKEERLRQENEALKSQVQNLTQRLHQLQDAIDIENTPSGQASCADIQQQYSMSGVYKLSVENVSMSVYCDLVTDGGGWTVFQRRKDGSVDFLRNWTDYTRGFGDLNGEFWLGLENLHILTSSRRVEMRVDLQAYDGTRAFVVYGNYTIGNSSTNYTFNYDTFQGEDAGNSLLIHKGHEFATQDHGSNAHCAVTYHGGWWFNDCLRSNLNGIYRPNATTPHADGIIWADFKMFETSLKRTEMKIRPLS